MRREVVDGDPPLEQHVQRRRGQRDVAQHHHLVDLRQRHAHHLARLPARSIGGQLHAQCLALDLHDAVLFGQVECCHDYLHAVLDGHYVVGCHCAPSRNYEL